MANSLITLQRLTTVSADTVQSMDDVVDLGAYGTLRVHVERVTGGDPGCVLLLQTAARRDASRFVDLMPPIDLAKTGDIEETYPDLMRYVRWRAIVPSGSSAQFSIDCVAREV